MTTTPNSLRALHFADGEWPGGASTELDFLSANFTDPLSDLGQWEVVLRSDDPDGAAIAPEDNIVIEIVDSTGTPTASVVGILDDDLDVQIDQEEEAGEKRTIGGPLLLGALKDGLIQPPNGTGAFPIVDDAVFDFTHPLYDDSGPEWVSAVELTSVDDAKSGGPNQWVLIPWTDDMQGDGGAIKIIAPPSGTLLDAPDGVWYGRAVFYAPIDATYLIFATADNAATISVDGAQSYSAGGGGNYAISGFEGSVPFSALTLTAGFHVIAWSVTNYPSTLANPTGIAIGIWPPGYPFATFLPVSYESTSSAKVNDFPGFVPGMTPSNVMRLWIESQQNLGRFSDWAIDSTDDQTSVVPGGGREEWAVKPTIAMRVGSDDGLALVLKIMEAYADVRVDVASKTIFMWNKDAYTQSSGVTLEVGNLTALSFHRKRLVADELLVQSQLTWARAGSGGRREGYLSLGPENNEDERDRLASAMLTVSTDPQDETSLAYKPRDDSELPYVTAAFVPGATAIVPTRDGSSESARIVSIGASYGDGEELVVTVVLKSLILQEQERILRQIKAQQ